MESSDSVKNHRWQEFGAKTQEGIQERTRAWTSWGVGGTNLQLKLQNKKSKEGEWVLLKYERERERERERAWSWEMGGRGRLRTFVPWLLVSNKSSSICIRKEGTKLLQKPSSYRWASWSCTQWHSRLQSNNIDHPHHRPTHPRIDPPKKNEKKKEFYILNRKHFTDQVLWSCPWAGEVVCFCAAETDLQLWSYCTIQNQTLARTHDQVVLWD